MRMNRWRPSGLSARIIGLTLLALLVSQAVGYLSFRHNSEDFIEHMIRNYMGKTVAALDSSLQFVEPAHRGQMVQSLSRRRTRYELRQRVADCPQTGHGARALAEPLAAQLGVPGKRVHVCITPRDSAGHRGSRPKQLTVALRRDDGRWLVMQQRLSAHTARWAWRSLRNI